MRVTRQPVRRPRRGLDLAGALVALSVGVLFPVLLATTVGIVALALGRSTREIVLGVLVVCFAAAAAGGGVVATVLVGRRARAARLQSDLLANVTHELRTPLAAIRMYAETLLSGLVTDDPARTRECLETIARETEWLEATVERVLSWRALARDRDSLRIVETPIAAAVEDAVNRFRRMVRTDEVTLVADGQSQRPVPHDRAALTAMVLNLLVNAYKYRGDGRRIGVTTRDVDGGVEVAVDDEGIGVPLRERERIFEPFHRVEDGHRGGAAGAGLGLAIVRHLAATQGGTVRVDGGPGGRGSTFTLTLPARIGGDA